MFQQDITLGPGTGTFTSHTFEIFIMLFVAFLMGLWMGWALWSRFRQISQRLQTDNDSLTLTVNNLRAELEALRTKFAAAETDRAEFNSRYSLLERENDELRLRLSESESETTRTQGRNRQLETELGLSFEPEEVAGADIPLEINTMSPEVEEDWQPDVEAELAGMSVEHATASADLVEEFGDREPAFSLDEWIDPISESPAEPVPTAPVVEEAPAPPAEEPAVVTTEPSTIVVMAPGHRDDLKIVEGIGPKIEELLFQNGVYTYQQLAETPVEEIRNILSAAGSRFAMHDPGTWSAQALLAANGEWDNLKAYQDFLNAGKRPGA